MNKDGGTYVVPVLINNVMTLEGTSKNSSVRGVSVIDTDNWLSRLTFSAI